VTTPQQAAETLKQQPTKVQVWVPDTQPGNARAGECPAWESTIVALRAGVKDPSTPWAAFESGALLGQVCLVAPHTAAVGSIHARDAMSLASGGRARMKRTAWRPTANGEMSPRQALVFSAVLCTAGAAVLLVWVNALTLWLTLATFVGYAIVYTVWLKPTTPQNIVIGGASGAMPPVLGWAAMRGDLGAEAWLMCLIIFLWTPPHFWALALYRVEDYARAGLPMLPVTHGNAFTRLQVLLYTWILLAATLLPFLIGMSGWLYLAAALVLGLRFCWFGWLLWRSYSDELARRTFWFSIWYLTLLFGALLVDHYVSPWLY